MSEYDEIRRELSPRRVGRAARADRGPQTNSEFGAWRAELTGARLEGLRWIPGRGVRARPGPALMATLALSLVIAAIAVAAWLR